MTDDLEHATRRLPDEDPPASTDPADGTQLSLVKSGAISLLLLAFLISHSIAPWRLISRDGGWHIGIADPALTPTTYAVTGVGLFVGGILLIRKRPPWLWYSIALLAYLLLWMVLFWEGVETQWSGVLHLAVGALALMSGGMVARISRMTPWVERAIAVGAAIALAVHLAMSLAQLAGIPLSIYEELPRYLAEGRPIGALNHPTAPGKVAALLQVPLLITVVAKDRFARRWSWVALAMGIPATAITLSRANTIAIVAGLLIWVLIARKQDVRKAVRVIVAAVVAVGAVASSAIILDRFLSDPSGGSRNELLASGLEQIARSPWTGTGPNYFVEAAGRYDPLVATGVPVHVTFLLALAELGIAGGVLLFLPLLITSVAAVRRFGAPDDRTTASRAFLATLPGILLIAVTGWGLIADNMLPLWWFVIGYAAGRLGLAADQPIPSLTRRLRAFRRRPEAAANASEEAL